MNETDLDPVYLATRVCDALAALEGELGISVEVKHDRVIVSGVVGSEERRLRAAYRAAQVCPGYAVENAIEVRPPEAARAPEQLS